MRVAAGQARAFAAFTDDLVAWWRPHPLFATTPRAPGRLALVDPGPQGRLVETLANGRCVEVGRVTAWEPPRRVVFDWRPTSFTGAERTQIEVLFSAVGDQTRVTVAHRGWDSLPAGHVARHGFPDRALLMRLGEWWTAQLGRYKLSLADA